jgi:hypothetical protein
VMRTSRIPLVLFGMQNRTFGPYSAAIEQAWVGSVAASAHRACLREGWMTEFQRPTIQAQRPQMELRRSAVCLSGHREGMDPLRNELRLLQDTEAQLRKDLEAKEKQAEELQVECSRGAVRPSFWRSTDLCSSIQLDMTAFESGLQDGACVSVEHLGEQVLRVRDRLEVFRFLTREPFSRAIAVCVKSLARRNHPSSKTSRRPLSLPVRLCAPLQGYLRLSVRWWPRPASCS